MSAKVPAKHRKLGKQKKAIEDNVHVVPLPKQAVSLLRDLHAFTGEGSRVFPSIKGGDGCMSEGTINKALQSLGYKGKMVGHGFRTIFSTTMNNQNFNPDAIEIQLSHEVGGVRGKYMRGKYWDERPTLMQYYADCLDGLRDGADIIPIGRKA